MSSVAAWGAMQRQSGPPRPLNRRRVLAGAVAGLVSGAAAPALGSTGRPVVVASKIDGEGALLGQMIVMSLRRLGVPVTPRLQLGPTRIVRTALAAGEIDAYPEYTGNAAFFSGTDADPVWRRAETALAARGASTNRTA